MGLQQISTTTAEAYTSGDVTVASIAVQAGDLIVVQGFSNSSSRTIDGISHTGASVSWSLLTSYVRARMIYGISQETGNIIITVDFAEVTSWGRVFVYVFRPDAGKVVQLLTELTGTIQAGGTVVATGEATYSETDTVVVAGCVSTSSNVTFSNPQIPIGTPAESNTILGAGQYMSFYSIFDTAQSGVEAQADISGTSPTTYIIGAVFSSSPSGGGTTINLSLGDSEEFSSSISLKRNIILSVVSMLDTGDAIFEKRNIVRGFLESFPYSESFSIKRFLYKSLFDSHVSQDTLYTAGIFRLLVNTGQTFLDTMIHTAAYIRPVSTTLESFDRLNGGKKIFISLLTSLPFVDSILGAIRAIGVSSFGVPRVAGSSATSPMNAIIKESGELVPRIKGSNSVGGPS